MRTLIILLLGLVAVSAHGGQASGPDAQTLSQGGNCAISYCSSCGYKKAFEQVKAAIEAEFPGLQVAGANHAVAPRQQTVVSALQAAQYTFIAFILAADRYFYPIINRPVPQWYSSLTRNRFGAVMAAFVIGNMIVGSLVSTGAFEVFYDGALVWSKLKTAATPHVRDILDAVHAARNG